MIGVGPYASTGYVALKLEPHLHTLHSDGRDTVADMFAACKSAGYQAVALTDHNTISGLAEAERAARDLDLVLVPGVEVTTFHGHAVALGVTSVPEWRDLEARGMDALASDVHAQGGVLSVAHPAALGSPVCSGCAWEWPIQAESADSLEVLNAARLNMDVPLALWRQRLEAGARLAPSGAGDVHSVAAAAAQRAATFVFVREPTREAVLDALRQRRVCASVDGPLELWLEDTDGQVALVGQCVTDGAWQAHTSAEANVVTVRLSDGSRCLYAELRDDAGALVAVSAPIWISTSH